MNQVPLPHRRRRNLLLVAPLALALVAGAACSDDDSPRANTQTVDSNQPLTSANNKSSGNGSDDSGSGSGSDDDRVLGSSRANRPASAIDNRSTPIRVDVVRLERHGDLIELGITLNNEAEPPAGDEDAQDFSLHASLGDGSGANARYDASGVGLVDGDAQKLYLPVYDSEGNCLCTSDLGANDIPPGGSLSVSATIGGVPKSVHALDVRVPTFPTIADVPVQ
jgi:hypothetical protein